MARMKDLDADGSGAADFREVLSFLLSEGYDAPFAKQMMELLDADGDGEITEEEWRKGVQSLADWQKGVEQLDSIAQSSVLLALTEPVEPPTNELFIDLLQPTRVRRDGSREDPPRSPRGGKSAVPAGCEIGDAGDRGILLEQLRSAPVHIKRRCRSEGWMSIDQDGYEQQLDAGSVSMCGPEPRAPGATRTLAQPWVHSPPSVPRTAHRRRLRRAPRRYDCLAYVVKPATRQRRSSFVELVASEPQPPAWYVSHWWGEAVCDTAACLEQHAKDRHLDINRASYWIAGFAINQWNFEM